MNDLLKQEEIDDLLGKRAEGDHEHDDPSLPREYDFNVQPNLMQHRFSNIEKIYEKFQRRLKTSLHDILKKTVEITAKQMTLMPSKDFVSALSVPTNINIIKVSPFKGNALVCLDARLVYAIVENYFGGDGKIQDSIERHEFTATEYRVLKRILSILFEDMNASWEEVHKVQYSLDKTEIDPIMLTWVNPHELMLVKKIRIELEGGGGDMMFALPISMLDPIKSLLEGTDETKKVQNDESWIRALQHEILEANIEIDCILANKQIKVKDVVRFKTGDIIPIEINETSMVRIGDISVYQVKFGTHEGNYAVKILGKSKRGRG